MGNAPYLPEYDDDDVSDEYDDDPDPDPEPEPELEPDADDIFHKSDSSVPTQGPTADSPVSWQ